MQSRKQKDRATHTEGRPGSWFAVILGYGRLTRLQGFNEAVARKKKEGMLVD